MSAYENAVQSLINGGYPDRQAREILSFVCGEAQNEGYRRGAAAARAELAAAVAEHGPFPMPVGTGPAPMTPDREQEIRTREQAATPGPWESDGAEIYGTLGGVLMIDLWVGEALVTGDLEQSYANAAFMAAARSAVPELLAEVDRLRARVAELEAAAEAYPGELAMLRGLLGVLRVVAAHGDMCEVRRLIAEHAADEQAAYAEDPCRPCGCPKRFDRHADGCPTLPEVTP
ncbi:hypothetical protein ACN24M_20260 [Streptomyces microflavus]|uniref:hypothetical protein n=1 Tax=Streptomyces microflavus TaxID=1919 RepID=UPI003B20F49B